MPPADQLTTTEQLTATTAAPAAVRDSGERAVAAVKTWLADYLCRPHPAIGRTGPVCPFVPPSLRAGSVEIRLRPAGPAPTQATVTGLLRGSLDEFGSTRWRGSNPALRCLLVLLPDLPDAQCHLLDRAHQEVKPIAVRRGLMLGQFHPGCAEPAARNPGFPVSRAPVPLVAVRAMALHDILFLHHHPDWFAEYRRRFGAHYTPGRTAIEPLFAELFQRAVTDHGDRP
jgi:hypothetical protein